jgi:hypothetical protein
MQTQRAGIDRQRALYEALFARMATPQMPQNKGRMESRIQPLQMLIQGLGAYMGHKKLQGLNEQEQQWGRQASEMQSQQAKQAERQAMIKALTDAVGSRAAPQALYNMHTQQNPAAIDGQFHQPGIAGANIDGMPGVMTTKPTGEQSFSHRPVGTTISVGGDKAALGVNAEGAKYFTYGGKGYDRATEITKNMNNNVELLRTMEQNPQMGAGAEFFQFARKWAETLGASVNPATTPTEMAKMQLGQKVLDRLGGLGAQVSDADRKFMMETQGSIGNDPEAVRRIMLIEMKYLMQEMNKLKGESKRINETFNNQLTLPDFNFRVPMGDKNSADFDFLLQGGEWGNTALEPAVPAAQPPGRIRRRTQ